jgi:hypothetical protein
MRLPLLIRFLLLHAAIGIAAGWLVVAGLLATNAGGLADVVFHAAAPALPIAMLMFGTAITFGGAAMGAGIMLLPYDGDGPRRRRRASMDWRLLPLSRRIAPARAQAGRPSA